MENNFYIESDEFSLQYKIRKTISGGFGTVYIIDVLAEPGKILALKIIPLKD